MLVMISGCMKRRMVRIYMLFTGLEVRTGKIFCRDFKNGPKLLRRPVRESLI